MTPLAVPIQNATTPKSRIPKVCGCKNLSATNLAPTDKPKKIVTILINAFCAVSFRRSTTPLVLSKLPKQNIPSNGAASGNNKATSNNKTIGKIIFSRLLTLRNCVIRILRSCSVVNAFIIGG